MVASSEAFDIIAAEVNVQSHDPVVHLGTETELGHIVHNCTGEQKGLRESPHPVDDSTVYPKALGFKPSHTLDIVRYRLVDYILPP